MAALPAVLSSSAAGFEVRFVDAARGELRRPLSAAVRYPFELVEPARSFPSFRGQRNNTGLVVGRDDGAACGVRVLAGA
jgi:hypothetical protein